MNSEEIVDPCNSCGNKFGNSFCGNCGKPKHLKRINGSYILSELSSVLNFDKGILYTIKELLIRPGKSIQEFILNDRNRLVKPILFIIITSLVYTLSQQLLHFEDGYVNLESSEVSATKHIFEWISSHYGYANILMALIIGFWVKLFFQKYDYNFFEILILLCYTMGMGMLIFASIGAIKSVFNHKVVDVGFIFGIVYISWAIGQFFEKGKKMNFLKAFLSYMIGMFSFFLFAFALGSLIDWIG
tara:strand:+ start:366 stop:1097 length:732 start_codon:yes stop_codon:yes gene_type:complete